MKILKKFATIVSTVIMLGTSFIFFAPTPKVAASTKSFISKPLALNRYYINIYPWQDSIKTSPVYFATGNMHIYIKNEAYSKEPIYYTVMKDCSYLECPSITSGFVYPGETRAYSKWATAGKYIFKVDSYGEAEAHGYISNY